MDPSKTPSAPPPGWNSGMIQPPPPSYDSHPQYPNAGLQGYAPPPHGVQGPPYGQYPPGQSQPGPYGQYPPGQSQPGPYGQYPPGESHPGAPAPVAMQQTTVYVTHAPTSYANDYLGYSIFTMLCCFCPLGIAALFSSIATRDANNQGNQEAAQKSSQRARSLNHIAVGVGITCAIIWIIIKAVVL